MTQITGIEIGDVDNVDKWDPSNPNLIIYIRGLLLIQFLGLFVIPSLLFAYFSDSNPRKYLGLKSPSNAIYWILGVLLFFVAIPAVEYIGVLNQKLDFGNKAQNWMRGMEEDAAKQIKFMLSRHSVYELAANLIFIAVFAGVGEELFFRGVLQRIFIRMFKDPWAGIVLTAALFSAFHFQFFGFFPRLALGVLLGAMYWYSGSLWLPIIVHFLYDALVLVVIYLNPKYLENPEQPLINQANQVIGAVISVGLVVLILWYMKKKSQASYRETYHNDQMPKDQFSF